LLYLGDNRLDEHDLPHCTQATTLLLEEYKKKHLTIIDNINNSEGQMSTTTDLWSDQNHDSYMAVTAQFMTQNVHGHLELMSHLI
ncbi:hypothetical protein J3A83DRAFT_4059532, partial [Scleroderma citrinum]